MSFIYPIELEDRYRFEHDERASVESTLNQQYMNSDPIDSLVLENGIFNTGIVGHRMKFLPGRIYSFGYIYTNDGRVKEAIDLRPLVLIIDEHKSDNGEWVVKGFNLNFLPKKAKVHFFQGYLHYFKDYINSDLERIENNNVNISRFNVSDIETWMGLLKKQFPKALNSIRSWKKSQIRLRTVKVVRVEDYDKIFEYSGFKNTIKGKGWETIQYETMS